MNVTVRELQAPSQGVDVQELAQQHHDEFGSGREFDVDAVGRACVECVTDSKRTYTNCWIAYNDVGTPIGYLAGTIRKSFYSDRDYAVQEMWYVVPHARGSRAAILLLREFEHWATDRNCERIYTCVEHEDDILLVERTLQLMCRLGYRKQGYIAVKVTTTNGKDAQHATSTHRELGAQAREAHSK